jgi:deoxyribodipyrimidine photolyase-related protein
MEFFYREMRRATGLLMEPDGTPAGGEWNYDAQNRKPLAPGTAPPPPPRFEPDAITREVMALVAERFPAHFGSLEGFAWPVTAQDARAALDAFVAERLPRFGDFQDAMAEGQATLFHALISTSLNCGLLLPREACEAAEAAYRAGLAPLNAVEGFIRQVLGWREYVRGLYWLRMPAYARSNALEARRALPAFYWTAGAACAAWTRRWGRRGTWPTRTTSRG